MKRIVVSASVLLMVAIACGGDAATTTTTTEASSTTTEATTTTAAATTTEATTTTEAATTTTAPPPPPTTTTPPAPTTTTRAARSVDDGTVSGTFSPGAAAVGQTVTFNGCGFQAGETVTPFFLGANIPDATADGGGCISVSVTIPPDTPPDAHPFDFDGSMGTYASFDYETL